MLLPRAGSLGDRGPSAGWAGGLVEVRGQGRVSTQRLGGRGGLPCLGHSQSVKGERRKSPLPRKKDLLKRLHYFPQAFCHLKKASGEP